MGTTTLEKYIAESVIARKIGLGSEGLAVKLGVDMNYLEMCENQTQKEIETLKNEKWPIDQIARILGIEGLLLREYMGTSKRTKKEKFDNVEENAGRDYEEDLKKSLQREAREKRNEELEKRREERNDRNKKVRDYIDSGITNLAEISRKMNLGFGKIRYIARKVAPYMLLNKDKKVQQIREAVGKGLIYSEDISKETGISRGHILGLSSKHNLGVKRKMAGRKEFVTNEEKRHSLSPESVLKDKLIREGYPVAVMAEKLKVSRQCVDEYIKRTNQKEIWIESKKKYENKMLDDYVSVISAVNRGYLGDKEIMEETGLDYKTIRSTTEKIATELGIVYGITPKKKTQKISKKEEREMTLKIGRAIEKGILETDLIAWETSLPSKKVSKIVKNIIYNARQKYGI